MTVPCGNVTIYAIANVPKFFFEDITNQDLLDNTYIGFYRIGETTYFPMKAITRTRLSGGKTLALILERYMSRFYFKSIRNNLTGNLKGKSMRLKHVYLTNLQGGFYINQPINSYEWYSMAGRPDTSPKDKDSRIASSNQCLTWYTYIRYGASIQNGDILSLTALASNTFYAFPNYATEDQNGWSESFTERYTRMVFVIEIDGTDYYYPINLTNMQPNTTYDVNVVITRLGSLDPDTFDFVEMNDVTVDFGGLDDGFDIEIEM